MISASANHGCISIVLKTTLTSATGGLYFPALEQTEAVTLRSFTAALIRQGIGVSQPLRSWEDAITLLFSATGDHPRALAIDEFPFLVKESPSLPSIIQRELGPGGSGGDSRARLILCGSAMTVMGHLPAGQAPLRGRASLELPVRPFGYREAAAFWGVTDPQLARGLRRHSGRGRPGCR
jgi:hypothetical protein